VCFCEHNAVTSLCSPGNSHFLLRLALGRAHVCWEWACDRCNDGKIPWLWVALSKDNTHENDTPFVPPPFSPKVTDIWTDDLRFKKKQRARENKTDRHGMWLKNTHNALWGTTGIFLNIQCALFNSMRIISNFRKSDCAV